MKLLHTVLLTLFLCSSLLAQEIQLIVPLGHTRQVDELKCSPQNKWLASTDQSSEIKVWNFLTGKETYHLTCKTPVTAIDYHPANQHLVSGEINGTLTLWDETGQIKWNVKAEEKPILKTLFSHGGDTLFTITTHEISLWNPADGSKIGKLKSELNRIKTASIDHYAQTLIIGDSEGNIAIIKLTTARTLPIQMVSEGEIQCVFPTEDNLLVGTNLGELIILKKQGFEISTTQAFSYRTFDLASLNNQIVACGRDEHCNLKLLDAASLESEDLYFQNNIETEEFALGLHVVAPATDSSLLVVDYQQTIREFDVRHKQWIDRSFKGHAAPVYDMALDPTQKQIAIASGHPQISILDLTGTQSDFLINGNKSGSRAVDFHPVNPVLAIYGLNDRISVNNLLSSETLFELKAKGDYSSTPITFDPTGRYILRKSSDKDFDFYNFKNNNPRNLKVKNGINYAFSPEGRKLVFQTPDGLSVYDPITFEPVKDISLPKIKNITYSPDGNLYTLLKDGETIVVFDRQLNKINELKLPAEAASDKLTITPDASYAIGYKNSVVRGESLDFSLKVIDLKNGELTATLPGHAGFTNSIIFVNSYMLTSSIDGLIKIWDLSKSDQHLKGLLIPLDSGNYVVTTPSGLYDATPGAMSDLHYIKSGQIIGLDQMKDHYYEPMLLSKLLDLNDEPIQSTANLSDFAMYPELTLDHPLKNEGKVGINLTNNGGGIGRIVILINGKEVSSDVRAAAPNLDASHLEIDYDITDHPYLYTDRVNKISIRAYNTDGSLSSEEKSLYVFGEEKALEPPHLYAIIAGTSDYTGDQLDLKYAAKDATDLAAALQLSSKEYLGEANTHITLLTTDQVKDRWPSKENIHQAFENYKMQAKANDILLVYLSGHGVNFTGENSDFYYLTADAQNGDLSDATLREKTAISSHEFTEYIKEIPALKQILIIDACHSGRMASSLASARSAMSSTQIRALERMKDRTGLFVLAGSAADAVSYETTLFGQGLLTYSLLFGMKGAALRAGEFLDVMDWFQFAANKVPELAEEIGGIQKPEIRMPDEGKSFDIGRLTQKDQDEIIIKSPKPVYVYSRFQDESSIYDRLEVGNILDRKLMEQSKTKDAPFVFIDDKDFSGAITINGRYLEENGLITARVNFLRKLEILSILELEAVNADQLTEQILNTARSLEP